MKTEIKKPRVEPGSHTWRFTRKEICNIVFFTVFNRKPTGEEIQRLTVDTRYYDERDGAEWLSLSFTDIPPTLSDVAQS